jgi:predicted adenylyl cyclase CyaB
MKEIEVKFKIQNIKRLQKALKQIEAKRKNKILQEDISFDNRKNILTKANILLRLRKTDDEICLTFKLPSKKARFKEEEEIEIKVDNSENTKEILRILGFYPKGELKKLREEWDYKNSKILIDQSPLGKILEIEGSKKEIEEIIKLLNLNSKKRITKTYYEVYKDYCKEKGIKPHPRFIILPE